VAMLCGNCGDVLAPGTPVLVITLNAGIYKVERPRYRCQACAGKAPPDLPLRVERSPMTKRMQPMQQIAQAVMVGIKKPRG
jgi:hypothetical protein